MIRYLIGALAFTVVALVGYIWFQTGVVDRLQKENASLQASIVAYESERELAREAQAVAEARATAVEARAKEYDLFRESILREGMDAKLPEWLESIIAQVQSLP